MKLYFTPGTCSLSVHITLNELEIPVELIKVNIKAHTLDDGTDFFQVNPRGYVPVLELDNGERLTECPAILQYVADLKPEAGMAPANGTMARYRLQEWLGVINSELHKEMSPLFSSPMPAEMRASVIARLEKRFDWLNEQLDGKDWAMGEQFTVVDTYLFTVLSWAHFLRISLVKWPVLKNYLSRCGQRQTVATALYAEGLA